MEHKDLTPHFKIGELVSPVRDTKLSSGLMHYQGKVYEVNEKNQSEINSKANEYFRV